MISLTAEYALRAVVFLSSAGEEKTSYTVGEIADQVKVPAGYLAKVLQSLSRAKLITSQRGIGGGFRLARAADEITVFQVVEAVDPLPRIHSCPLGLEAHAQRLCHLHKRLDDAMAHVEAEFKATVISELVEEAAVGELPLFGQKAAIETCPKR